MHGRPLQQKMGPVLNVSEYIFAVQVCYFLARWVNGMRIFDTVSCLAWIGFAIGYLLCLYVTEDNVPLLTVLASVAPNVLAIPAILSPSRASVTWLVFAVSALTMSQVGTSLWARYFNEPERVHEITFRQQAAMCAVALYDGPLLTWWIEPLPRTKWKEFTARIKQ